MTTTKQIYDKQSTQHKTHVSRDQAVSSRGKNCGKTVSESIGVPTTVARRATKTQAASVHREFHSDDDSVQQWHDDVGTLTVDGASQRRRQRPTATRPKPRVEQATATGNDQFSATNTVRSWPNANATLTL